MVSICKITKFAFEVMFLLHTFACVGQNVYNSKTVYYNMDTSRCADKAVRLCEGDKSHTSVGNSDSIGKHCKYKKSMVLPIVTVNDVKVTHVIDSCLTNAAKSDYLKFPDSSGYFIELLIFEKPDDSSMLEMIITPISNYYMSWTLANDINDVLYEWYGYREKNLQSCFFSNGILCVIASFGNVDYERAACLFPHTQSTIQLELFEPAVMKITTHGNTKSEYYYFKVCGSAN